MCPFVIRPWSVEAASSQKVSLYPFLPASQRPFCLILALHWPWAPGPWPPSGQRLQTHSRIPSPLSKAMPRQLSIERGQFCAPRVSKASFSNLVQWSPTSLNIRTPCLFFFNGYLLILRERERERERERVCTLRKAREGQRKMERENPKQAQRCLCRV